MNPMEWLGGGAGGESVEELTERARRRLQQSGTEEQARQTVATQRALDNLLAFYGLVGELPLFRPHRHENFRIQVPICVALLRKTQELEGGLSDEWENCKCEENEVTDMEMQAMQSCSRFSLHVHECYDDPKVPRRELGAKIRSTLELGDNDLIAHGFPTDSSQGKSLETNTSSRYIICLDHDSKSILVLFHGAQSLTELIRDVMCDVAEYMGGSAHSGLLGAMLAMQENIRIFLGKAREKYPDYGVRVTGHGLGAGIAVLFMIHLFMDEDATKSIEGAEATCIAFAPPPTFTRYEELPEKLTDRIWILVNNTDFIPRLSVASFNQLNQEFKSIDTSVNDMQSAMSILTVNDAEKLRDLSKKLAKVEQKAFTWLQHPGRCLRLSINSRIELVAQNINSEHVHKRMVLSDTMFSDHLALEYEIMFKQKLAAGKYIF